MAINGFPATVAGTELAIEWANLHRRWMDQDAVGDLDRSFMEILGAILRAMGTLDEPCVTVAHHGITRARAYLDEHFAEPVSLRDLAIDSGLSRYHLLRSFEHKSALHLVHTKSSFVCWKLAADCGPARTSPTSPLSLASPIKAISVGPIYVLGTYIGPIAIWSSSRSLSAYSK